MMGSYELEITFHSYHNPTGRCQGCVLALDKVVKACCDDNDIFITPEGQNCSLSSLCDTGVEYCFKPLESTSMICPSGAVLAPTFLEDTNLVASFGSSFFGANNPIQMTQNTSWQVRDCLVASYKPRPSTCMRAQFCLQLIFIVI